jgi:CHAT domain-containing protein
LKQYARLHFAAHALLDERTPARSGIVLASSGKEDGILRTSEVSELDLDADLVVLSACQTGLGKEIRGEGINGLTRAFLQAGARRVAVSLWNVDDRGTADFMNAFYRAMQGGGSPGAGLRAAKLGFVRSASPVERHPFYWAGFVMIGRR